MYRVPGSPSRHGGSNPAQATVAGRKTAVPRCIIPEVKTLGKHTDVLRALDCGAPDHLLIICSMDDGRWDRAAQEAVHGGKLWVAGAPVINGISMLHLAR
jgi:hypothetical protein